MDYKRMVKELLEGSSKIDRMKKEIFSLTKIILGLTKLYGPGSIMKETFESNTCKWVLTCDENGELFIECKIWVIKGTWIAMFPSHNDISLDFVQEAFNGLPILLKGWLKIFPHFEKRIKPFLEASKVKF